MKIHYGILVLATVLCVAYCSHKLIAQSRYDENGDYIAEHYMPLVRTMETFDEVVAGKSTGYKLVVVYVYNLTEAEQRKTKNAAGALEHTPRYRQVDNTYRIMQSFAKENEDRFDDAGDRGVKFVGVNLQHGDMERMKKKYNVRHDQMLLFFRDGVLQTKEPIRTTTFSQADLKDFLQAAKFDDFLDDEIQRYDREEAREKRRRRRIRRRYYGGPYGGWGYGYRYPYGGYWYGYPGYYHGSYYYRRPYGGFYVGLGW